MLYATERKLRTLKGEPLQFQARAADGEPGKPGYKPAVFEEQTAADQLATLLLNTDCPGTPVERSQRFMLATKLQLRFPPHDLDSKEVSMLRKVMDHSADKIPLLLWGQLDAVLDGKPDPIDENAEVREPKPVPNGELPQLELPAQ